jgi:hypothetical protein
MRRITINIEYREVGRDIHNIKNDANDERRRGSRVKARDDDGNVTGNHSNRHSAPRCGIHVYCFTKDHPRETIRLI